MTTFLNLKQASVQGYRARQLVTGTVPTNGTTTVIPDNNRQEPQGEWERIDSFIKFTSGANIGVERRVTGFSPGISLTVAPALSASVGSGTNYQIVKTFPDSDVGLAVNSSLRDSFPDRIIQSIASVGETDGGRTISVPSAASNAIAQVIKVDRAVASTAYDYTLLFDGSDYSFDENNGVATMITSYTGVSGAYVRFHYQRPAGELSADADTTDEPASLIIAGARKWLAMAEGDAQAVERFGREFEKAKEDYQKNRNQAQVIRVPVIKVRSATW